MTSLKFLSTKIICVILPLCPSSNNYVFRALWTTSRLHESPRINTHRELSSVTKNYTLTINNVNPKAKDMEYAYGGPLAERAGQIAQELEKGIKKEFTEVIKTHIGDLQAMGQPPITFVRQVLALLSYPKLLDNSEFPPDAKERARVILSGCRGNSVGSYTDSPGIEIIRRHVAQYIQQRDGGIPCDWQDIILSPGAMDGIRNFLKMIIGKINGKRTGVMLSIPSLPLYLATLGEYNLQRVGYYLDESKNWGLNIPEMERAIEEGRKQCNPRALIFLNPGNPTGQVLSKENIVEIIKFAYKEKLYLVADEVYQHNIYTEEFHSCKKVLKEMGKPYSEMELVSFMSCSKGYVGECGSRGGYTELTNMNPEVKEIYLKAISSHVCPSVFGQAVIDVIVNPPKPGEPSYEQFTKETNHILETFKIRGKMVVDAFNTFEGFHSNPIQGALYAFPQIKLPPKAIEAAKKQNKPADEFYVVELLERTGVCCLPGSGFGQQPGTYHFRTTIVPPTEKLKIMLEKFRDFHAHFVKKYS